MRRTAGSLVPAFNAGLVIGVILFFAAYWPHAARVKSAWLVILFVAGALVFWVLGVSLIFQGTGGGWLATLVLVGAGTGAGWIWREPAWLGPVTTLSGAVLACVAVNWLGVLDTAGSQARTAPPAPPP